MEQIKEKKWWFVGAIGLMLVILLTGLLFNFSSVGKNLIEGIGKNATTKTVQISYDYFKGGSKPDAYQKALQPKNNVSIKNGTLKKGKNYLVFINADNAGGKCRSNREYCAFCLDPSTPLFLEYKGPNGQTKDTRNVLAPNSSNFWTKLSASQRKLISLVLLYGYPNNYLAFSSNYEGYIATQVLIWEIQQGYRTTLTEYVPGNRTLYNMWIGAKDTKDISFSGIKKAYNTIIDNAKVHDAKPSFDGGNYQLEYNASTKKYELTLNDSRNVLQKMEIQKTGICQKATCTKSGSTLKISSDKAVSGKVTLVKKNKIITKGSVIESTNSKIQKAIIGVPDVDNVESELNIGTTVTGLKIKKTDSSNNGRVKGIKFRITCPKCSNKYDETIATDDKGEINLTNIEAGTYTVEELNIPSEYIKLEPKTQTINAGQTATFTFNNALKDKTKYKVRKIDVATGETLDGAVMSIKPLTSISIDAGTSIWGNLLQFGKDVIKNIASIKTWTTGKDTDKDGWYTLDLTEGKYLICEIKAPEGYEFDESKIPCKTITIEKGIEATQVEFSNKKTETKFDKKNKEGKSIEGAELEIIDVANKKVVEKWVTDGSVKVVEGLVKNRPYILREVSAPNGYQKHADIPFLGGQSITVTMTDLPTEVEISKTDITGSNELAGAKLYVVSPNGETIEEWTSTGKTKKISGLPVGKGYKLCEEAAPDGYLTAECVEFEVKENGTSKVEMKDELMKITIVKVDSITGEKLSGAELQLIDPENDNKVLETWTTDGKEYVIKAKLTVGKTYVIKETKVPEGYVSNPVPIEFTVGNTNEIKIENTKPHIEVFKYDKVTGNALKGAHLQLLDDKGKLVEEWDTTDEVKVITNLKTGVTYTIKETKVPNNYKVESEKIKFKLSADETSRVISIANIPVVPVKNTAASTSIIIIVAGAVLMIGGVGALIFLKKKEG